MQIVPQHEKITGMQTLSEQTCKSSWRARG